MRCLTLLVILLTTAVVGTACAYEGDLTVGVGEQKIVPVPPGSDITFTGPLHIVQLDAGRIKIIGDGAGWGSVTVKNGNEISQYSVTIVTIPPEQTIGQLESLMGDIGLTYSVGGGQVIVEGRIETTKDLERFNRVIEMFPSVVNMVVIAAKEALIDIAVTLVEVEATTAADLGLLNIAPPTASATMTGTIPLSDITAGKINAGDFDVSIGLSTQLLNALSAQIQGGQAKIIANPRIITQNRKEASITSGGEIPYRVISATGGQGVEYKQYGITLRVTPEERANDVLLQLHLESSEPVGVVNGVSENPLTSRSVDLNLAVDKDKTLAVAGLYDAVTSHDTRGGCFVPLFAASSSTRKREIIVLVTPRVSMDGIGQDYFKMVKPKDLKR